MHSENLTNTLSNLLQEKRESPPVTVSEFYYSWLFKLEEVLVGLILEKKCEKRTKQEACFRAAIRNK